MFSFVDDVLNRVTMYRLVLYYLLVMLLAAFLFDILGILPYNPAYLAFSTVVILITCAVTNFLFAKIFDAHTNVESFIITALILALIISPVSPVNYAGVGFLLFASVWAMASKYILAIGKKHIFNPAAFGVALSALVIGQSATWWAGGNYPLLPIVLIGGLLVVRKLRRFDLISAFAVASLATIIVTSNSSDVATPILQTILHSSFFFLAFVMLTEPLTMPAGRTMRIIYGALVGFLFAPNVHIGSIYFTPELALLTGNVFAYLVNPKGRFMLTLSKKEKIGAGIAEFIFTADRPLAFQAGQYLEWTLPHKNSDTRGNRRYFTASSSPSKPHVSLGIKFYEPSSSFKEALLNMQPGETISASHIAGDFTLPSDTSRKLAFIAGGIGITPFKSMIEYMLDANEKRPVTLLYGNKTFSEIAYKDFFDRAQRELGIKVVYAINNEQVNLPGFYKGFIDADLIRREIPDYKERSFYISGPHSMIEAFQETLSDLGIPRWRIKVDFFPGFV